MLTVERKEIMKKLVLSMCVVLIATTSLTSCSKKEDPNAAITISQPVVRSIDAMSSKNKATGKWMTGSFMTISNTSNKDITLVGGSSDAAGVIEIHEVTNGVMTPMKNGLVIPANGSIELRMGGYHVMLLELTHKLLPGEEVSVHLDFDNGAHIQYIAPVKMIAMDDEVYGVAGGM